MEKWMEVLNEFAESELCPEAKLVEESTDDEILQFYYGMELDKMVIDRTCRKSLSVEQFTNIVPIDVGSKRHYVRFIINQEATIDGYAVWLEDNGVSLVRRVEETHVVYRGQDAQWKNGDEDK